MDTKGEKTFSADLESYSPFNKASVSQSAAAAAKMQAEKEGADSSLQVSTIITESLAAPAAPRRVYGGGNDRRPGVRQSLPR